jgi:Tol biopolymer transport system component
MSRFALIGAAAATIVVVGLGGVMLASRPSGRDVGTAPTLSPAPSPSPTLVATPSPRADYADVPGRLLVQHLGNALDGSEADPADGHYDRRRLYFMNPDGSGIAELLPGQPASGKNHADVSPDRTRVVFQDTPAEGASTIYEANLDGSGFRQVSTDCDCAEGQPAYSPDGRKIAFTRWTGDTGQIGVRDLASGEVTMYSETEGRWPAGAAGYSPEHASWSPDGALIVYALIRRDGEGRLVSSQLLQLDVTTREVTDLGVPEALGSGEPRYSPDGSLILFASRSAETTLGEASGDVYTVRPDGSGLRRLTGNGDGGACDNGTGASWTPDGRYIVYMCDRILLMEPDGSNKAMWSSTGPDLSTTESGYGYTTYWIPPAP